MVNLAYTCVQIVHNFGAVAVVGSPVAASWLGRDSLAIQGRLGWLLAIGWVAQGASGAAFGLTSYLVKGQLPELAGTALVALAVKMGCVLAGLGLTVAFLSTGSRWSAASRIWWWNGMAALAAMALSAAAVLRWFA
jgi:hypothetical protein